MASMKKLNLAMLWAQSLLSRTVRITFALVQLRKAKLRLSTLQATVYPKARSSMQTRCKRKPLHQLIYEMVERSIDRRVELRSEDVLL